MRGLAFASLLALAPQDAPLAPGDKLCGECQTTGRVAFEVPKEVVELEKGCTFCSEVVANEAINHGIAFRPCPRCQAPSLHDQVKKLYDAEVAKGDDWLKGEREIDLFINDPKNLHLMHVSTPHFELAWSVPKVKVGKIVLDQHHSMHLYAERLEALYQSYLDTFSLSHETDQGSTRHHVMVFETAKHANKAQPKYCGMGGTGITDGVKLMGFKSFFVCWWNKTKNKDDPEFNEYLDHNVIHLFFCPYYNFLWLARKNGWVDEGLAHYFTDKKYQMCRSHCFQEQDAANNWPQPPWRPEIRKRVLADKIPVFSEVVTKHGENLTAEEHLFVFSWVEYLIDAFDHKLFMQMARGLKDQTPLRNVMQDVYGVSPFQFIENWKKYVIENYPPR